MLPEVANDFGHRSVQRNPLIFSLFTRMQLVEKIGSGIPRMAQLMRSVSLPETEYLTSGVFVIKISRPEGTNVTDNVTDNVTNFCDEKLSDRQREILKILQESPTITTTLLSQQLYVSRMTIHRDMNKLSELGIVKREGSDKSGKWVVVMKV